MRKIGAILAMGIVLLGIFAGFKNIENRTLFSTDDRNAIATNDTHELFSAESTQELICSNFYDSLKLEAVGLSKEAFRYAWFGFQEAGFDKPILAIADFSQSSRQKRLYVIDFENHKVLLNTYVAHGRNSGQEYASKFSNVNSSYQSSLGFYRALGTYQGKHGLSLRLQGLEKNINDQAFKRAIVMHGADYVSEAFIRQTGRLGRSLGCPAVSQAEHKQLITLLRDGAGLFLYYPDAHYLSKSKILHQAVATNQSVALSNS
jgi:hypothetical protein